MLHRTRPAACAPLRLLAPLLALCAACSGDAEPPSSPDVVQAAPPSSVPADGLLAEEPAPSRPEPPRPRAVEPERRPPRPVAEQAVAPPSGELHWDGVLDEQQVVQSPATVVTLLPAPDAVNVARDANVEITFPAAMQVDSVESAFQARTGAGPIAGALRWDAATNRAIFEPAEALPAGALVTVELAGTLCADGSACEPVTWSFTTGR